jgi:Sporulation protein and related proteins
MEIFRKASPRPAPAWATVSGMRRRALRLGALCLLLAGGAVAAVLSGPSNAATTPTTTTLGTVAPVTSGTLTTKSALILTGHGWGHGLGLSQWGAYGYAKHGWTYDRILTHYYVGTSLGAAPVSTIRVLVAQKAATTLSSTAAWTATDSAGTVVQLAAGAPLALKPDFAVEGQTLVPPVTFRSTAPLTVDGKAYRGKLVVSLAAKQLLVVNKLGLEAYVKGVVPMEMPSNWAPEAVKAQAVAARSYALANVAKGRAFDVYGDGRSQVYGGVAAESPAASAPSTRHVARSCSTPARSPTRCSPRAPAAARRRRRRRWASASRISSRSSTRTTRSRRTTTGGPWSTTWRRSARRSTCRRPSTTCR